MSIYVISDLHGHLEVYEAVREFLKPEDVVYCLGDCGDRGPKGWATIKAVYDDPQWIYIKGNHEDMLVDAMKEYLEDDRCHEAYSLLKYNGGYWTLQEWINEGSSRAWIKKLQDLPERITLQVNGKAWELTHAGFSPKSLYPDYIWDRRHIEIPWPKEEHFENTIIIHGHTPIPYNMVPMEVFEPGAYVYCSGHKINIDNGGFFTGKFCLYDIETGDEHIFETEEENEDVQ
jgi:predicted phosphodiesterase